MNKNKEDIVGILPFDANQMRELLQIYQQNYNELQNAYNQMLSFLVLLAVEAGGIIEVPLSTVDEMNEKETFQISAVRDEERGVFVVSAKEALDGQVSEISDGPVSTDGDDGRSDSDSGQPA